ncbi:hypothetical protein HMPREF0293_1567 [Corynebacterium glucuronolyticum ATCC 51866]|uniref:Uncharacterized protein n=1 Tax=Corynebacterium glucuronolyticum ATCC 51866 TaxID=548478 RepID=A0ABM9XPF1_9CORY|nr:hypothetical protein HMPREF0293_1567 [Corynebacterium glucuronolyticum ATCC 51866]
MLATHTAENHEAAGCNPNSGHFLVSITPTVSPRNHTDGELIRALA